MTVEEQTAKDIDELRQEVVESKENSHRREKILESALEFYSARLHQDPECRSNRSKSSFKPVQWVEDGLIAKNALKDYRKLKVKV